HRLCDVPDLVIDDGPEHDARAFRQLERRTIDNGGIIGALARDHGGHGGASQQGLAPSERGRVGMGSGCFPTMMILTRVASQADLPFSRGGERYALAATRNPTSRSSVAISFCKS